MDEEGRDPEEERRQRHELEVAALEAVVLTQRAVVQALVYVAKNGEPPVGATVSPGGLCSPVPCQDAASKGDDRCVALPLPVQPARSRKSDSRRHSLPVQFPSRPLYLPLNRQRGLRSTNSFSRSGRGPAGSTDTCQARRQTRRPTQVRYLSNQATGQARARRSWWPLTPSPLFAQWCLRLSGARGTPVFVTPCAAS